MVLFLLLSWPWTKWIGLQGENKAKQKEFTFQVTLKLLHSFGQQERNSFSSFAQDSWMILLTTGVFQKPQMTESVGNWFSWLMCPWFTGRCDLYTAIDLRWWLSSTMKLRRVEGCYLSGCLVCTVTLRKRSDFMSSITDWLCLSKTQTYDDTAVICHSGGRKSTLYFEVCFQWSPCNCAMAPFFL